MTSFPRDPYPTFQPPPGGEPPAFVEQPGTPDPGSRGGAKVAWALSALFMAVLIISNQFFAPKPPEKPAQAQGQVVPPDPGDSFTLSSKLSLAWKKWIGMDAGTANETVDALAREAITEEDKLRLAIITTELKGAEAGLARLDEVKAEGELKEDVGILRAAYEGEGRVTDPAEQKRMEDHHAWFGKLAALHGVPDTDRAREELLAFFPRLMVGIAVLAAVLFVAVVGGAAAFITMVIQLSNGRIRRAFVPPAPGGSVYLETFPFFVGGYLLLHFGFSLVASLVGQVGPKLIMVQLGVQWVLALFTLYPVVFRGVPFAQWRRQIGLHRGAGFWREVGAGIYGYFAALPLLAAAMVLMIGLVLLRAFIHRLMNPGEAPGLPYNPVSELLNQGSPLLVAMLFFLATCWAPLVEETIFRGALFRHLRSRLPLMGAALVSALFFGFMHGYNVLLLAPVITIGFVFALMREWRGSLIASMTGHFLHNATALTVVLVLMNALKD